MTFTAVVRTRVSGDTDWNGDLHHRRQAETPVPLADVGGVDQAQFSTSTLDARRAALGLGGLQRRHKPEPQQRDAADPDGEPATLQPTTTTLSSSLNPSTFGQQVTFTAVVTAPGFPGTPTGTVTFTIDGQAQLPCPRGRRGRGRGAVPDVDARGGAAHGLGGLQRRREFGPRAGRCRRRRSSRAELQPTTTTLRPRSTRRRSASR